MAFKLTYSFEGNHRTRPEQNLSGASRKETRDNLLQRAHDERQKRQNDRMRLQSAETIQSYTRSYLIRKHIKQEQRIIHDSTENSANIDSILSKLLFFFDYDVDFNRLIKMCIRLMDESNRLMPIIKVNQPFRCLIKRLLSICVHTLTKDKFTPIILTTLERCSHNLDVITYLLSTGYYEELRKFLETTTDHMQEALNLIHRPFFYIHANENVRLYITREFTKHFMTSTITPKFVNYLIPLLKAKGDFPYADFVEYLCQIEHGDTNNLLYWMLSLEPINFGQSKENLLLLSLLSTQLHTMYKVIDLSEDSDDEEDVVFVSDTISLQDYIKLLNKQERVKSILNYFTSHSTESDVLDSLTRLCHSLLLIYKDSIRKFMLVYMLALKGTFLNMLWNSIKSSDNSSVLESATGTLVNKWKECQMSISVFCDMFTFYTETLTDSESSDTSGTFTNQELARISDVLKAVALNLIETAYPMCRSNSPVSVSEEVLHLYYSSLKAIKKLHMLDLRKKFCDPDFWTKRKLHISKDLTKKNYLMKVLKPFSGTLSFKDDEEQLPPLSSIEQRSLAILQELPFLIEFNERVLILRELCFHNFQNRESRLQSEFFNDGVVTVRRAYLYEDSFEKVSQVSDMRRKLRIQFINQAGLEEVGIDGGGIFKEFISEVLKTAFDPNRGFFLLTADNTLYPNPQVHLIMENFAEHYYFIGRLVGKAIFENILVDLPLAEFFLAKLLVDRANAYYLESLDPVLHRNLLYLRDYSGDVQDLGLDFTLVHNDLGETRVYELKPNGSNIPVTNYNRLEYIHRLADLKLNALIKKQCAAFREGLDSVVPLLWLKLFSHIELQVIVSGDTQEIDIDDLMENTVYGGEYSAEHPTIVLFWKVVHSFTEEQKKMLLKFVTSCSRAPLLGFKILTPMFGIQSSGTEDRMPTASTCLNLLKLPIISDEQVLRNKLLAAIEQQAGFELS